MTMQNTHSHNSFKLAKPFILAMALILFSPIFGMIDTTLSSNVSAGLKALSESSYFQTPETQDLSVGTFRSVSALLK